MFTWFLAGCGGGPAAGVGEGDVAGVPGGDDEPACCAEDTGESGGGTVPDVDCGVPVTGGSVFGDAPVDLALALTDEAIAGLATSPDDEVEDVPGTLTIGGESWLVGVRLKGGHGSFRTFEQKAAFKIDFGEFVEGQRFEGARHLNVNNYVQDGAMLGEHAAYALWSEFGVPAPRHGYARVTVNGERFGLYGLADAVDGDLVARCFADASGPLFEGEMDDFTTDLVDTFAVVADGGLAEPHARLVDAVSALDAAPHDGRASAMGERFDYDVLLDAMAVELVTGNDDAYATFTNNFFVYADPATGRLVLMEWGPDQAFGEDLDVLGSWPGRLFRDCRADATCDADLRGRLADVAARIASPEWRGWIEGVAEATRTDCEEDPRSEMDCAYQRERFFDFLDRRPGDVYDALDRP
ncbi:MAG: CotH kinase family protein [Myxococcota bacterium]